MTLSAVAAYEMSLNAQSVIDTDAVNTELGLIEARIANVTTYGGFSLVYGASLVGNPVGDPNVDTSLTTTQLAFRDALRNAGYVVSQDGPTKYWAVNWNQDGPEQQVVVYEIQTTVVPGSVQAQTIAVLSAFFGGLDPVVTERTLIASSAISGTYVHLSLVDQQDSSDLSASILAALVAAGLGYTGGNTSVTKRS